MKHGTNPWVLWHRAPQGPGAEMEPQRGPGWPFGFLAAQSWW